MKATHLIFAEDGDVFKTDNSSIIEFAKQEGGAIVIELKTLIGTCDGMHYDVDEADPSVWCDEEPLDEADDE